MRQGGADRFGSGRRGYVRLSRSGGRRGGLHDRRGAASAQRLCGDLRALLRVKTAEPRVKCGGVPSADARGRGAYRTAGAGNEALLFALRAGQKAPGVRVRRGISRQAGFQSTSTAHCFGGAQSRPANFFLLPGAALAAGGVYMLFSSSVGIATTAAVFAGSVLMLVTGCIFCSGTRQSLAAAEYISAAEPDIPVRQALKKSREIMCGHCRAYARFKAGFALWFLSCALILPAFFVVPYYEQSCAVWMTETVKLGQKSSFYTE